MRTRIGTLWLLAVTFVPLPRNSEASEPSGPDRVERAIELVTALLDDHRYLTTTRARSELAELAEKLAGAPSDGKEGGGSADGDGASGASPAAFERLVALLESLPQVVEVRVREGRSYSDVDQPIAFPGDVGGMLLRIQSGAGETRFLTVSHDLSGPEDGVQITAASSGTTWALIGLTNVPVGRSSLLVKIDGVADRWIPLLLTVSSEARGRLKVTILSAGSVKPTPAMVRLTWKTNGHSRKPSNGVEFSPQFDSQGDPADPREAKLPGRLGGEYWCVPGPFDMSVPSGEWEIVIRRGLEHIAVFDTFGVAPGQFVERTYQPRRWVDMRETGWYSGDTHVHGRITSDRDAAQLMAWIRAEDVHVASILKMGDINRTRFEQRGFGPAFRVQEDDYVLVPGQECPRSYEQLGHTISLNTRSMVRQWERYYMYDEVFKAVRKDGGVCGYAHVESDNFYIHRAMTLTIPGGDATLAEVMQFGHLGTELYYEFLNLGFKLTASAGSDVPWGGTVGEVRMYAHLGDRSFEPDAWFDALREGHTFVTNGPMIDFQVGRAIPGDEIVVDENKTVHVRARAWGHAERMVPTSLEVVCQGDVIRRAVAADANEPELLLEFDLPTDQGYWIAARAEASDGSQAHTTPIYVVRQPFRFWKHSAVEALLRKRFDELSEVEGVIGTAQQLNRQGRIEYHRPWKEMAVQAPELLERVRAARSYYGALQRSAERERALRTNP